MLLVGAMMTVPVESNPTYFHLWSRSENRIQKDLTCSFYLFLPTTIIMMMIEPSVWINSCLEIAGITRSK